MKESLSQPIDAFLDMLTVEKGLSINTREAYSRDLNKLAKYLDVKGLTSWNQNHSKFLKTYVSYLTKRSISVRSIARGLVAYRQFYRFLLQEEIIKDDPLPSITFPNSSRKLPSIINR